MAAQEEIQQKMALYQLLTQRIDQLGEQASAMEQKLMEIEATKQALDDLKKAKPEEEVLIPLGSGCYTQGKTGPSSILLEMGAGIMVSKTLEEAKKAVEEKGAEAEKLSDMLQEELRDIISRMNQLGPELQAFLQEQQGTAQKGS